MRPIDLQDNLSKAPLASRAQQIQQNSADQAQRQGALRLNDEHAHDQTRTKPTDDADPSENRVDRDPEGQAREQSKQRDQDEHPEDEESGQNSPGVSPNSRQFDTVV
ncbi:MAG: hypothetical protein HN712_05860 [Gemmatimonadetes bacterium]|nr:hypothetical protein [Gemmatimonadota bacterium]MBT6146126.1 hypothetical protein [Gemmatimonadota bacterium]MBT7859816.1 hypothetical protein [Gemmatimonadota bacterium]